MAFAGSVISQTIAEADTDSIMRWPGEQGGAGWLQDQRLIRNDGAGKKRSRRKHEFDAETEENTRPATRLPSIPPPRRLLTRWIGPCYIGWLLPDDIICYR
jgi:hypothetical protein